MDKQDTASGFSEIGEGGGLASDGPEADGGGEGVVVPREMRGLESHDL